MVQDWSQSEQLNSLVQMLAPESLDVDIRRTERELKEESKLPVSSGQDRTGMEMTGDWSLQQG